MEGLKVFDKEESGKILAAELRHILLALGISPVSYASYGIISLNPFFAGERLSADEVDEMMKGVEDGEGMVSYEGSSLSIPFSIVYFSLS